MRLQLPLAAARARGASAGCSGIDGSTIDGIVQLLLLELISLAWGVEKHELLVPLLLLLLSCCCLAPLLSPLRVFAGPMRDICASP